MFYVFTDGKSFIKILHHTLQTRKTSKIEQAAYWCSKGAAKSWERALTRKYPTFEMKPATLTLM